MNKEALRKELEDCWDASNDSFWWHTVANNDRPEPPDKSTYITTRLAAVGDGDDVKQPIEILEQLPGVEELFKYGHQFFDFVEANLPPMTKDEEVMIEEIIKFKRVFDSTYAKIAQVQPKPLDDGQEGKGLRWVKASERLPGKNWEGRVKTMGLDGNWIYQTLKGWQVERLLTHELDLQAEWLSEG